MHPSIRKRVAPNFVEFSLRGLFRSYNYIVRVRRKSGQVVHIKAGCQFWQHFGQFYQHYNPSADATCKWSDSWVEKNLTDAFGFNLSGPPRTAKWIELTATRSECRKIHGALKVAVDAYQVKQHRRIQRERAKAREQRK